jgi:hypothetical protein
MTGTSQGLNLQEIYGLHTDIKFPGKPAGLRRLLTVCCDGQMPPIGRKLLSVK